ncbi:TonB-dependent receptor [Flavihumibacter fluvii]|uniref:TonB-dependent receptor n=1 Tax=Flavihumibacter fluvii TaxID=2838157 RepID=UPI001BDDFB2A|nr:TonB-dependent receptor plug domain-containing protein [Flavihumibacter fluvii]ULQ52447.1 TonB-dependent receptor plug domain-containing protein [Flavihumibacter fluvii]
MRYTKYVSIGIGLLAGLTAGAQAVDTSGVNINQLDSIYVQGYSRSMRLRDAAAAVGIVGKSDWQRFSPVTLLPATNMVPGVRMEERSPGSYRLAIRGSSLRSPFGVRNIRMYLDQLPFTDPGGNTYINGLAPAFINRLEILKGPAGSSYGAGTGGAVIASTDSTTRQNIRIGLTTGSYGLRQGDGIISFGNEHIVNHIVLHHQRSEGYRRQTEMERIFGSWQATVKESDKASLSALVFYSDLNYQTPGGLTLAQYEQDPRQARPAAGAFPSAEAAHAAIRQRTIYTGLHQEFQLSSAFNAGLSLYGAFSRIENPSIRNYEQRSEPHFGGRANFSYTKAVGRSTMMLTGGAEWQQGIYQVNVYRNKDGEPDSLQTADDITPRNALIFSQLEFHLPGGWHPAVGISWNSNRVEISRETDVPVSFFTSDYKGEWSPRFSLAKSFRSFSVYGLVSKGFSPPTTTELLPSTSVINKNLQAEWGWNYELGIRGGAFKNRLWYDLNVFYFRLQDAIVQRRDSSGADYFDNAGSTKQFGFEGLIRYVLLPGTHDAGGHWKLQYWASYALQPFKYDEYKSASADFNGNFIPGIAKQVLSTGLDLQGPWDINAHLSYQYVDPIWLNDANTAKAKPYQLLGLRIGSRIWHRFSGFAGADNLLNMTYSLGNDINAAAGRYYNAAMPRNYYAGIIIDVSLRRDRFR